MIKRILSAFSLLTLVAGNAFSQSKTISGGNDHGLIICAQGYLYTWGNNFSSTVGGPLLGIDPDDSDDGAMATAEYVYKPSRVKTGNLTFNMVTSGSGAFNLALSCHKVVYAWGENTTGSCGQGSGAANVVKYPVPVLKGETPGYTVDGKAGGDYLGGVVYVAASTNSGFAIMDDGRVVGWGSGAWNAKTGAAASEPAYIKGPDGKDLTNVTHISGGDDNLLIRTSDGLLYGIGPYNGSSATAVTKAAQVLKADDEEPLTDIRMSAAGDVCGFAVTGDGYVWSWGGGGWGGCTGIGSTANHNMAKKVVAGEYKTISGEDYLTDVKEVIGGRGHGAAVTKEGYLLYWGCNDGNGGIAPTDAATLTKYKAGNPVLARYCDASGKPGPLVDDAVSISRGDNFDFMVNDKDEFYVWGLNDLGQAGTGNASVTKYNCLTKLTTIPCEIQDNCPTVFMVDRKKCPGEEIELDCGYVIPKKKEDRYFISWWHDGELLNTSRPTDPKEKRLADKFNKASIFIDKPGVYKVKAEYVGQNIPCDACTPDSTEITVEDMMMPVDTFISTSCVPAEIGLKPNATHSMCYKFKVNNKFYKAGDETSWIVRDKAGNALDTLDVIAGETASFCVTGDKVKANDNSPKDTTYSIFIEDNTKISDYAFKNASIAAGKAPAGAKYSQLNKGACYYFNFNVYTDVELGTMDVLMLGGDNGGTQGTLTATVYQSVTSSSITGNETTATNNQYAAGEAVGSAVAKVNLGTKEEGVVTLDFDGLKLKALTARGTVYTLCLVSDGQFNIYSSTQNTKASLFDKKVNLIEGDKHHSSPLGTYASINGDVATYNVQFYKLTDYTCGAIELENKRWCPPCNSPSGIISIASTVEKGLKDTVFICKETGSTTLSVDKVVNIEKADAKFDILWFDNPKVLITDTKLGGDAGALQVKEEATSSSYTVNWDDIPEGESKTYYLKIRDNEKPEADGCWVYDSIVVKAVKVPEVPTIKIDPYCEGDDSNIAATVTQFFTMPEGLTVSSLSRGTSEFTETTLGADLSALTAGDYTYSMVVKDAHECVSDPANIDVKVNEIPGTPVIEQNPVSYLKETGKLQSLLGTVVGTTGTTVLWATSADLSDTTAIVPSVSLDKQDTIVYQVLLRSEFGCVGEPTDFTVIINDAPAPKVKNDSVCIGSTPDFSLLVTPLNDNYQLKWYTSEEDALAKENGTPNPSYDLTVPGKQDFFVTQTNLLTGAESAPSTFTVTAIGVNKPTVLKPETLYCKGAAAVPSVETMVELSEDGFYKADQLVWKNDAGGLLSAQDLVPSTDGIKTTYTYFVNQTYTISPTKICEGLPEKITVNISVVPTLTVLPVSYVLSDGKDKGGRYPTLIQKNPNVATPSVANGKLQWYDLDGVTALPSCPAPPYIADQVDDVDYVYYVSQIDENGCESDKTPVSVTVSTSPAPTPVNVELCEDDDLVRATPLQATPGKAGVTDNSEYELVWYGLTDPNGLSAEQKKALNPTIGVGPSPVDAVYNDAIAENQKCVYTYYVAQRKVTSDNSGAEGKAQPLLVTVYQKPQLKLANPTPVCEPNVVNLANDEIWAFCPEFSDKDRYVKAWYYGNPSVAVTDPTSIAKSGPFDAQVYFLVNDKACLSDKATVNVTVDYIRGLEIVGSETTCPGTTVDLKAETTDISNPSTAVYTWNCESNDDKNKVVPQDPNFTTTTLIAGLGARSYVYTVSVSAGACKNIMSAPHSISIGDGPVQGAVVFTETDNTDAGTFNVTSAGLAFYSCGNALTIDVSGVDHTLNDFAWTDVTAGTPGTPVTGAAILNIAQPQGSKKYHVSYTNNCPTGFDITVVSVPVKVEAPTRPNEICQGDDYVHPITVVCDENSYKVVWSKDNLPIAETDTRFKANGMTLENAQPTDNGVYAYTVTNRGCTYSGSLNEDKALKVKPNIQFTVQDQYIARRDSVLEIPLNITVPADGKLQTIQWKSAGVAFEKGNPLSLSVQQNYNLDVVLSDPEYCDNSGKVSVIMDARLMMKTELLADMICSGESTTLVVDTTGTGSFYFPNHTPLNVVETVDGEDRVIEGGWMLNPTDNKLYLNVKPKSDAIYTINYSYRLGEGVDQQRKVATQKLRVLPPIEIVKPEGLKICGDGENEIEVGLVSVTPVGTNVVWTEEIEESSITSGNEGNSIMINPIFDENKESLVTYKSYIATATYSICSPKTVYVSVRVDRPLKGSIVAPEAICEGTSTTIDASSYMAEIYNWVSESDLGFAGSSDSKISVSPVSTSTYNVEMTRGECAAEDEFELIVAERPVISKVDSVDYNVRDVIVDGGTSPYYYWIDKITTDSVTTSIFNEVPYGKHTAYVVDAAGCDAKLPFVVVAPEMVIQKLVSPNGDGVNDVFSNVVIREAFPNAKISIFDRWGKKLAEYKGSDNGWDGTYNGQPMPSTDYWYEIEIKELKKTYTGHFTLMRQ